MFLPSVKTVKVGGEIPSGGPALWSETDGNITYLAYYNTNQTVRGENFGDCRGESVITPSKWYFEFSFLSDFANFGESDVPLEFWKCGVIDKTDEIAVDRVASTAALVTAEYDWGDSLYYLYAITDPTTYPQEKQPLSINGTSHFVWFDLLDPEFVYTDPLIVMFAGDLNTGAIWIGLNGTWCWINDGLGGWGNQADPVSGTDPTLTSRTTAPYPYAFYAEPA